MEACQVISYQVDKERFFWLRAEGNLNRQPGNLLSSGSKVPTSRAKDARETAHPGGANLALCGRDAPATAVICDLEFEVKWALNGEDSDCGR
jgi:hypothetical protein